jgi:predicted nucleic acid-binding protein
MSPGARPELVRTAVVDAGVVLTRLDRRRRSHRRVVSLFDQCARGDVALYLSTVNLAEVLQHGRPYSEATGLDLVAMVTGFGIALHSPDAEVARVAAELATVPDLSLADRFAAATARLLRARLHTTDPVLVRALRRGPVPVTGY